MTPTRTFFKFTVLAGLGATPAAALPPAPTAEALARTQPAFPGIAVSTPASADAARCRVEAVPGADGKPIGHVLLDANNRVVRRFLAVGTNDYNIRSFYMDGQEVFRETDSNGNGKADQFRWLGTAGSKWGKDAGEIGRVTEWVVITPEEVSRELFDAVQAKDDARLKALLPTDEDLKRVGLPEAEVAKVRQRNAGAVARLQQTAAALALTEKAKWVHVELNAPQTTPADAFGGKADVVRHRNAGVLVDKGDNKAEFFQTGELVLFGQAWKVIDGPLPGSPSPADATADAAAVDVPESVRGLVKKLGEEKEPADPSGTPAFQMARAKILEEIVTKLQGNAQQEAWVKQLLDAYATASEAGAKEAQDRLAAWKKQIDSVQPKSAVAAYAAFRALGSEYAAKMRDATKPADVSKVQGWWKDELEAYVKAFPNADETPEALFRLGMAHEFSGRDGEAAAKQWYGALAKNFATHPLAAQSQGAVTRLDLEGKPLSLAGNTLTNQPINVAALKGNVTVVYFWASWSRELKDDAQYLTDLTKKHGAKLNVVTVCMDSDPKTSQQAVQAVGLPGVHLFAAGNALANQYGVMGRHLMVVGKDGLVANKNGQFPMVGEEVDKLVK